LEKHNRCEYGMVRLNKERVSHSMKTKERNTILEYAYASDAGCHQRKFIPALSVGRRFVAFLARQTPPERQRNFG
jgi:hypothetical protein